MNINTINPLEQHVEKIVLAVAAAGAIFLGYLSMSPITVPDDPDVNPKNVDDKVAVEVSNLQNLRNSNKQRLATLGLKLPDYVDKYNKMLNSQTLPPDLLATTIPLVGPINAPVLKGQGGGGVTPTMRVVTPTVPMPDGVTLESFRNLVGTPSTSGAAAAGSGSGGAAAGATPAAVMHDQNAVRVQGYIPVAQFKLELNDPTLDAATQKLPAANQEFAIYRIHVQRAEKLAGSFGPFKDIPPTKASAAPTEINWSLIGLANLAATVTQVEGEFKLIALPDFYPDENGKPYIPTILQRAMPAEIAAKAKDVQDKLEHVLNPAAAGSAGTPGGGGLASARPLGGAAASAPAEPVPTPAAPLDPAAAKKQAYVPFCFWDETVVPGQQYKYQVSVELTNPTFQWAWGLAVPSMGQQGTLTSGWTPAQVITVPPDVNFFVMGTSGSGRSAKAQVRVYRYTGGKWYLGDWGVGIGMPLQGPIRLVDQRTNNVVDVDTHYTIVDVVPGNTGQDMVVLVDGKGDLITRDASADYISPDNRQLAGEAVRPPSATAPTTLPGGRSGR